MLSHQPPHGLLARILSPGLQTPEAYMGRRMLEDLEISFCGFQNRASQGGQSQWVARKFGGGKETGCVWETGPGP